MHRLSDVLARARDGALHDGQVPMPVNHSLYEWAIFTRAIRGIAYERRTHVPRSPAPSVKCPPWPVTPSAYNT